jgi:hypothetical protein
MKRPAAEARETAWGAKWEGLVEGPLFCNRGCRIGPLRVRWPVGALGPQTALECGIQTSRKRGNPSDGSAGMRPPNLLQADRVG